MECDLPPVGRVGGEKHVRRVVGELRRLPARERDAKHLLHAVPVGVERQPAAVRRDVEASIVWFPLVTGRACATDSGAWLGIGRDQTFDGSRNARSASK